jgi:hypothetical protein
MVPAKFIRGAPLWYCVVWYGIPQKYHHDLGMVWNIHGMSVCLSVCVRVVTDEDSEWWHACGGGLVVVVLWMMTTARYNGYYY